ncbi:hypothetical protein RhiJN_23241 [Ceratobasidium sp. AG-Ba]|nr:hypothetical protein RhiJN_23241 [Ceratobasidium sp. AG-Ba]
MTSHSDTLSAEMRIYGRKLYDNRHSLSGTVKTLAAAGKDLTRGSPKPSQAPYDHTHPPTSHGGYDYGAYNYNPHADRPFDGGGGGFVAPGGSSSSATGAGGPGPSYPAYNPYGQNPNAPTFYSDGHKPSHRHSASGGGKSKTWAKLLGTGGESLGEWLSAHNDSSGGHSHGGGGHGDGGGTSGDGGGASASGGDGGGAAAV